MSYFNEWSCQVWHLFEDTENRAWESARRAPQLDVHPFRLLLSPVVYEHVGLEVAVVADEVRRPGLEGDELAVSGHAGFERGAVRRASTFGLRDPLGLLRLAVVDEDVNDSPVVRTGEVLGCGAEYDVGEVLSGCPACRGLLDVTYDWDRLPVASELREFEERWANRREPIDVSGIELTPEAGAILDSLMAFVPPPLADVARLKTIEVAGQIAGAGEEGNGAVGESAIVQAFWGGTPEPSRPMPLSIFR